MAVNTNEVRTLTVEEARRALGLGRSAMYEAIHRGEIPSIRIGKKFLIPKVAFERMLAAQTGATDGSQP